MRRPVLVAAWRRPRAAPRRASARGGPRPRRGPRGRRRVRSAASAPRRRPRRRSSVRRRAPRATVPRRPRRRPRPRRRTRAADLGDHLVLHLHRLEHDHAPCPRPTGSLGPVGDRDHGPRERGGQRQLVPCRDDRGSIRPLWTTAARRTRACAAVPSRSSPMPRCRCVQFSTPADGRAPTMDSRRLTEPLTARGDRPVPVRCRWSGLTTTRSQSGSAVDRAWHS